MKHLFILLALLATISASTARGEVTVIPSPASPPLLASAFEAAKQLIVNEDYDAATAALNAILRDYPENQAAFYYLSLVKERLYQQKMSQHPGRPRHSWSGWWDEPPGDRRMISNACWHISAATNVQYILTVPDEHCEMKVRIADSRTRDGFKKTGTTWEANHQMRQFIPRVIYNALIEKSNAPITLQIITSSNGKSNSWNFYPIGAAEGYYVLRCLGPDRTFTDKFAQRLAASPNIQPLSKETESNVFERAQEITIPLKTAPRIASLVLSSYNTHRAELIARFGQSTLFYPKADDIEWSFREGGGNFYAVAGCSNQTQSATFVVQLDRIDDRNWNLKQIYARETSH